MKRGWIVGGWGFALLASALLPLTSLADRIERNHLGKYVDPETGSWTIEVVRTFLDWWLPIAGKPAGARLHVPEPAGRSIVSG